YFATERIPKGQTVKEIEPYPACSGCIRASFETAGMPEIDLVSHAPAHPPMRTIDLEDSHAGAGEHGKPPAQAGKAPAKPPSHSESSGEPTQVKVSYGPKPGAATGAKSEPQATRPPNMSEVVTRSMSRRFGRTMGEIGGGLVVDLIISLLVAKYQQWLNDRKLRERLEALQPVITTHKLMSL